jgi:hypothetical protein
MSGFEHAAVIKALTSAEGNFEQAVEACVSEAVGGSLLFSFVVSAGLFFLRF